jgi:DNA-binding Lrp family transcriptional regulator
MKPLDDKDKQLLEALRRNARASLSALGHAIGLSRSATHDRIVKLEERGVIEGYTIRTGPGLRPPTQAFLTLSFKKGLSGDLSAEALEGMEGVRAAYCLAGDVDMLVHCECDGPGDLNALRTILASHPEVETITTRHVLASSGR